MEHIEHVVRHPAQRTHQTPILLQHGAWHGAWCWVHWLDYLPALGYETHAISLPGHGHSTRQKHINLYTLGEYVRTLAREVEAISPRPVVVGHSMGGGIVQKYLEDHCLPGAVLLAPLPASGMLGMMARFMRRHPAAMLKGALTLDSYRWVGTPELARELFFGPETTVDAPRFHEQLVHESTTAGLQLALPFAGLNDIPSPVLVLAGERDAVFTLAEEKKTAAKYHAKFVTFKGQGHDLMLEPAWQQVADTVDRWIVDELKLP